MTQQNKCPLCEVEFTDALWCPCTNCPMTEQRGPTAHQLERFKIGGRDNESHRPRPFLKEAK